MWVSDFLNFNETALKNVAYQTGFSLFKIIIIQQTFLKYQWHMGCLGTHIVNERVMQYLRIWCREELF